MNIQTSLSAAFTGILIHWGLHLNALAYDMDQQSRQLRQKNMSLSDELEHKQLLEKDRPQLLHEAFTSLVNQTKTFEIYSGTQMKLLFGGGGTNDGIEDHSVDTEFRKVKGLALTMDVSKFSNETGMAEVLNDVYLLETRTDFKVTEISSKSNGLIVKGELYGI